MSSTIWYSLLPLLLSTIASVYKASLVESSEKVLNKAVEDHQNIYLKKQGHDVK